MTTYYVSSEIGNNNNAGTSESAPLATLQDAANLVKPGDTVEVMNGTYTAPGGGDVLDITTSGTASAPITFEAAPGQTPVIDSSGGWNAINIKASYIVINGLTVVGDAAGFTSQTALAGYSTGNANLDGNGIAINPTSSVPIPNHIIIENNTVYNEPGGGIYTEGADYVQILNNTVHDNAHWSAFGNSGISVSTSANSDTNSGVHDIISGNLVYGNAQLVPTVGGNAITDGEGIILDTNPGFVGQTLVENNTVYGNGGPGIESFLTDDAVITLNTVYGNNTQNVQAASNAQIFINQSNNNTVTNNTFAPTGTSAGSTTTAPPTTTDPPAAPVITTGVANADGSVTLTGTAPSGSTVTVSDGPSAPLGTKTASTSGTWSFTTANLAAGSYVFTATDTTPAGTSAASSPSNVTVNAPPDTGNAPPNTGNASPNLIVNGGFETDNLSGWTVGGNTVYNGGPAIFVNNQAESGGFAASLGSVGSDGTLSQTIQTTAGQQYTLSFWLANDGSSPNDFTANWNGAPVLALTNAPAQNYTEYTFTVTATGNTSTLEFDARQDPSMWELDQVSVSAVGAPPPAATTPPPPNTGNASPNLIVNGGFETDNLSGWTVGGNTVYNGGPAIFVNNQAESGGFAASLGSVGSDGTLSQTIQTTAGEQYTLSFWLANDGSSPNDFTANWNGAPVLALTNAPAQNYTEYTFTVTATGNTSTLEFDARQDPSMWELDQVSLSPVAAPPLAAPAVQSGAVNISGTDPTVTLTGTAPDDATVTVSDGGSAPLGTTTASSSGAWSYTTPDLPAGNYAFTVTDTTPTGTTTTSQPFDVTVPTPSAGGGASGLPRIAFDPPSTLGSWSNSNQTGSTSSFADISVLGSHIASSFALPSGSYGGTMVNSESTAFGTQPLVANSHHA